MKSYKVAIVPGIAAVIALLIGLVITPATGDTHWPGPLDLLRTHAWPSFFVLAIVSVGLAAATALAQRTEDTPMEESLSKIGEELASTVRSQWEEETNVRYLNDPFPLAVRWKPADADLVHDWASIVQLARAGVGRRTPDASRWAADPAGLAGGDQQIVQVLDRVPTGRLVVLGDPGSGKTILLIRLVLGLLNKRQEQQLADEPIPVLLSLASWNPGEQGLLRWIESRLLTDYPFLAARIGKDRRNNAARAMLYDGRILPVLDGLDEIPETLPGLTVEQINKDLRPGMRIVLAARSREFRQAVRPKPAVAVHLAGAAAIELMPVETKTILDYLEKSAGGSKRWEPVRKAVERDDQIPLAKVLTTPLMAFLARTVYNPRPDQRLTGNAVEPAELLDPQAFPDEKSVKQHLYDKFVPAAYRPRSDDREDNVFSAEQAERWLAFLASELEVRGNGTTDMAWWQLRLAAPRYLSGLVVGVIVGIVAMLGLAVPLGVGAGLVVTVVVAVIVRQWVPPTRRTLPLGVAGGLLGGVTGALANVAILGGSHQRLGDYILGGLIFGIVVAPVGGFPGGLAGGLAGAISSRMIETISDEHGVNLASHVVNGIGVGFAVGVATGLAIASQPARRLRRSRLGMACGVATGIASGIATWLATAEPKTGLLVGGALAIAGGYAGGVFFEAAPTDPAGTTSPVAALLRDRATFRASFMGFGIPLAIGTGISTGFGTNPGTGHSYGLLVGLSISMVNLIVGGLAFAFIQASWGSYLLSRSWLALKGDLPWPLMRFLADAHAKRGVLRQVGAVYQFRHMELQQRLASQWEMQRRPVREVVASKVGRLLFGVPSPSSDNGLGPSSP